MIREHKFLCRSLGNLCVKKIWMRQYASSPRDRGERIPGVAEGASSAPRLASSSGASLPGRNECPGSHCSLIEQEEREDTLPDLPQSLG